MTVTKKSIDKVALSIYKNL